MRTNIKNGDLSFFVVGPPRSGTTIVASALNSLEDGFCLGEPHWYYHASGGNIESVRDSCGKVAGWWKPEERWGWQDILPEFIWQCLCDERYNVGGYKETYRYGSNLSDALLQLHIPIVDFIVVVLRDPVLVHSSQRALGWVEWDSVRIHNATYKTLDGMATKYAHKTSVVVYEDFIVDPIGYLNERLPFETVGEFELQPTGHAFGDPAANLSTDIEERSREVNLTPDEIKMHSEGRAIWKKWRKF